MTDGDDRLILKNAAGSGSSPSWHPGKPLCYHVLILFIYFFFLSCTPEPSFNSVSLLCFPVKLAGQEEEDQARDQDPGEPARRHQHNSTGGHSQRPSGRLADGISVPFE